MAIAFVKQGSGLGSKSAGSNILLGAATDGHAVGNLLIVHFAWAGCSTAVTGDLPSIGDAKGNTWTLLSNSAAGSAPINGSAIFASILTTALVVGDSITCTTPAGKSASKRVAQAIEFSGASLTEDVADGVIRNGSSAGVENTTTAITPSSAVTLVIGAIEIEDSAASSHIADSDTAGGAQWTDGINTPTVGMTAGSTGGSATSNIVSYVAYKITTSAASQQFSNQGTLRANTNSNIIALQPAVSGNDFTATPADAVGVTDSIALVMNYAPTIADPVGVTDALSRFWAAVLSPADNVGVTDSITAGLALSSSLDDPVGVTDLVSLAEAFSVQPADAVGVTDALAKVWAAVLTPGDPVGVTDAAAAVASYARSLDEPVAITDVAAAGLAYFPSLADAVAITDALASVAAYAPSIADTVGITDLAALAEAFSTALADAVGVMDAPVPLAAYVRSVADPVAVTDESPNREG
jgi:hypothetical protein